jgi:hypothetical protein
MGVDNDHMRVASQTNRELSQPVAPRAALVAKLKADTRRLDLLLHDVLGDESPALQKYRAQFAASIDRSAPAQRMKREACVQEAAKARVVYCADNHATTGSQNVCLELLDAMLQDAPATLVLEIAQVDQQPHLDAFCAGKIDVNELETKLNWGFSFAGYARLLVRARDKGVTLRAANSAGTLKERDHVAGEIIAQSLEKEPDRKVLVLFGKLHMGRKHLPGKVRQLAGDVSSHTVLTGDAESYHLMVGQDQMSRASQLNEDTFCIYAVSPRADRKGYIRYLSDLGVCFD